jgi:hypothetical protein
LDHHGPWCQREDGVESAGEPAVRAERAKSRSVNMRGIVAQREASKWRKKALKVPLIGAN